MNAQVLWAEIQALQSLVGSLQSRVSQTISSLTPFSNQSGVELATVPVGQRVVSVNVIVDNPYPSGTSLIVSTNDNEGDSDDDGDTTTLLTVPGDKLGQYITTEIVAFDGDEDLYITIVGPPGSGSGRVALVISA